MRNRLSAPTLALAFLALVLMPMGAAGQANKFTHSSAVRAVAFAPDGKTLATACQGETVVHLWDLVAGKPLRTLGDVKGGAQCLAYSPNGKILAAGGRDGIVHFLDPMSGKPILQLKGHEKETTCAAFAPDGKTFASGSQDNTVRVWDTATGKELSKITEPNAINAIAFTPDGKMIAVAGWFKELHLWDIAAAKIARTFTGHQAECVSIAISPDGRLLASGSLEQAIRIWEVMSGDEIRKIDEPKDQANALLFSPNGRLLLAGYGDRSVRLFDLARNQEADRNEEHQGPVFAAAFSPDGKWTASGGADGKVIVRDVSAAYRSAPSGKPLPARNLERYWTHLGGRNSYLAYRAIWELGAVPQQTMPMLQTRLEPFALMMDRQRIGQMIAELDDDRFVVRENATKNLEKMGGLVAPILQKTLMGQLKSLEVRRRIERILEKINNVHGGGLSPEVVQAMRAVTVLEALGTPEAKLLLEKFARGMPEAQLTLDAKAALERLGKRAAP